MTSMPPNDISDSHRSVPIQTSSEKLLPTADEKTYRDAYPDISE